MKRIKVKLVGKGTEENPYRVNLPTWRMDGEADYKNKTCYVLMLDDEVKNDKIDQEKIRKKYKKNWSNFNASEVEISE